MEQYDLVWGKITKPTEYPKKTSCAEQSLYKTKQQQQTAHIPAHTPLGRVCVKCSQARMLHMVTRIPGIEGVATQNQAQTIHFTKRQSPWRV